MSIDTPTPTPTNFFLNSSADMPTTTIPSALTTADFNSDDNDKEEEFPTPEMMKFSTDRISDEESRHFLCIPLLRIFNLELQQPLETNEHIALIGSDKRLGEWQVDSSVEMRSLDGKRLEWLAKVPICASGRIAYRYFIYTLDGEQRRRIRVWEGQQHPRILESYEIYRQPGIDYFGNMATTAIDVGEREGMWLRYERLIELKFIWQRQLKLKRQVRHKIGHRVRLKLSYMGKESSWNQRYTTIEVSRYSYNHSAFRKQPPNGVVYNFDGGGNIVVFRIIEPPRVHNSYKLNIFTLNRVPIGEIVIHHIDLQNSEGVLRLPIHSATSGFEIGQLTLPYLIVQALPQAEVLNMRGSYQHFWPLNWPTMHVGNRGTGKTFYGYHASYVENTIKSFQHVHTLHGDIVELDVQLTRDYVPVVWHEYGFYTAPSGRRVQSIFDLNYELVRELNFHDLRRRRIFMLTHIDASTAGIEEITHLNIRRKRSLENIFPKLSAVYQRLPKTLGLIVDLKWPQPLHGDVASDKQQNDIPWDKNRYVNTLLKITAQYGCGRPLIFTSFDADICTMLRYKQNVYPAMFQTMGNTDRWQKFKDLRTHTFTNAVNFAQSESLLGTSPYVENFLYRPKKIELGLDLIQVVFVWGDELLQNNELLKELEKLHVTGLIYDRLDLQLTNKKRFNFFDVQELTELFDRQCTSTLFNATNESEMQKQRKSKRKYITIHIEY